MSHWPLAVLFDFDGVIVNSEPLHFLAFHEILADEKIELTEAEYYREMIGFDDAGAFRHIFASRGRELDPRTFLRVMTRKSEVVMDLIRRRKLEALPGAEEFVRALAALSARHLLGALREEIEAMLEGVSLRDCFSVIIAAEDVDVGKPDPRGYMMAMKQLAEKSKRDLTPPDCLIVEDAPKVIARVKDLGFKTLAVASSTTLENLADADYAVPSLAGAVIKKAVPELRSIL